MRRFQNKLPYLKSLNGAKLPDGNRMPDGAYRVLVTVLNYADENGQNAYPGIERLAEACDMGRSTVRRHLQLLVDAGYLHLDKRGHGRGASGRANRYSLDVPSWHLPLNSERKHGELPLNSEQTYRSILSTYQVLALARVLAAGANGPWTTGQG